MHDQSAYKARLKVDRERNDRLKIMTIYKFGKFFVEASLTDKIITDNP